jgi:hypothetical protein
MNTQQGGTENSFAATSRMGVPVGRNLTNPALRTLAPFNGSIGFDDIANIFVVGVGDSWTSSTSSGIYTATAPIAPIDGNAIIVDNGLNTIGLEYANTIFPGIVSIAAQSFSGVKTFASGIVAGGTNYSVVAPIVAINNNGLVINNVLNTLTLQIADATHNGIITTTSQMFSGVKIFSSGIVAAGTNYTADTVIAATDNNGIIINNITSSIRLEEADLTHNGIVNTTSQTFGGLKMFPTGIVAAGTNYLANNSILAIDNRGIVINNTTSSIVLEEADASHYGIITTLVNHLED